MAETLTKAELDRARAELARVNEAHGFKRNERGTGPKEIGTNSDTPADNSSQGEGGGPTPATPADPGPPRFIGIDIEHKLAGLSGGGVIPLNDAAIGACVDILLGELKLHLARTLGAVADTHKRPIDHAQLDLFKDSPEAAPEA